MSDAADIRDGGGSAVPWRELAAGHEAGHAVVAWHYGAHIDHVTIAPVTTTDGTEARGCVKAGGLRSRRAEAACDLGGYAANIFPWVRFLPTKDVQAFLVEVVDTMHACAELGNPAAIAPVIAAWKATAEIYSDPELLKRALEPLDGGDYGEVTEVVDK